MNDELTILTGASSNHYNPLLNLLESLRIHEPDTNVEVWDLGLTPKQRSRIEERGWTVQTFPFDEYPPHCNFHRPEGELMHAWKPVLISQRLFALDGLVLWLDAGNLVHAPLDSVRKMLHEQGIFFQLTSIPIGRYAHPETLRRMSTLITEETPKLPMVLGGLCGFTRRSAMVCALWRYACLDPECVRPKGWNRAEHRSDQIILSILVHRVSTLLKYQVANYHPLEISWLNDDLTPEQALAKCTSPR